MNNLINKIKAKNLTRSIDLRLRRNKYLVAYWSNSTQTRSNWGDLVNSYILEKLSGRKVLHINSILFNKNYRVYSSIGSILDNNRINNLHVWGTGMKSNKSKFFTLPEKVYAVRGPLTRSKLLSIGIDCPDIYGDPALLFPKFYHPKIKPKFELGIVPHYIDKNNPNLNNLCSSSRIKILDINAGLFSFPNQLLECKRIASSSLHGLILADAYGIPNIRIKFSEKIAGGDFKFLDYFESVNRKNTKTIKIDEKTKISAIINNITEDPIEINLVKLLDSCPFKE